MSIVSIPGDAYSIKLPPKSAFAVETPPDQLPLHQLACFVGSRGSGKSVIISSLLQGLKSQGCMDRVFMLSPTIESNRSTFEALNVLPEDEYTDPTPETLFKIIEECEKEMNDWEQYEADMKCYKLLKRILSNKHVDINSVPPDLLINAMERGYIEDPPVSKYGHKPVLGLVVDDLQGTQLYQQSVKNPFINLCLRHRHVARGLGLSIFMAVQSYSSPSGVPKSIRQNITSLFLGQQKNSEVVEQIATELGGSIDQKKFMKVFELCNQPHSFLCIDFHPKSKDKQFRRNLGEYIV